MIGVRIRGIFPPECTELARTVRGKSSVKFEFQDIFKVIETKNHLLFQKRTDSRQRNRNGNDIQKSENKISNSPTFIPTPKTALKCKFGAR